MSNAVFTPSANMAISLRATAKAAVAGSKTVAAPHAKQFEAALLSVMFEQALPKGESLFGRGLPGTVARTQLSQQLAQALAASGVLNIADRLLVAKEQPITR
jgi:Rod binding domain-containing protein